MNKEDLGITYIYRERKREKEIYSLFRSSLSSKLLNKNSARYNIQKKKNKSVPLRSGIHTQQVIPRKILWRKIHRGEWKMTIEERFAKKRPIWFNNIHPSRIGQFVEPSNTFCPLFPLLSLPVSRYKNLGHRMESWDIAYEPRTGRCNHRATFSHLSSFLRFVFSFFSRCRRTRRFSLDQMRVN